MPKKVQGRSLCAATGTLALALAGIHIMALALWLPNLEHRAGAGRARGRPAVQSKPASLHLEQTRGLREKHSLVHGVPMPAVPRVYPGLSPPGAQRGGAALDVGWHHSGSFAVSRDQQRLKTARQAVGAVPRHGVPPGRRSTGLQGAGGSNPGKLRGTPVQKQGVLGRGSRSKTAEEQAARLREEWARRLQGRQARELVQGGRTANRGPRGSGKGNRTAIRVSRGSQQLRAFRTVGRHPPPPAFDVRRFRMEFFSSWRQQHPWPPFAPSYSQVTARNRLPTRNAHLPLGKELPEIVVVLYVHNRPQYLNLTLQALSGVRGIQNVLLIVSHDGQYQEVDALIQGITFCRVKQIYAPWSPHLFNASFPASSPGDCQESLNMGRWPACTGTPDSFGRYRSPTLVSLKHHWFWLMNTVWDGLEETREYQGHMLFMEEDHYLFPNALEHARELIAVKDDWFKGQCSFATLAPFNALNVGTVGPPQFVVEAKGNIGYIFDRSVWRRIHQSAQAFCQYDDYNWDVSLWRGVLQDWRDKWAVRWVRASAQHIGKCGLHFRVPCDTPQAPRLLPEDFLRSITRNASVLRRTASVRSSADEDFKGWGGWGDERDRELCLYFANMYRGV